jgi:hypothetical protein
MSCQIRTGNVYHDEMILPPDELETEEEFRARVEHAEGRRCPSCGNDGVKPYSHENGGGGYYSHPAEEGKVYPIECNSSGELPLDRHAYYCGLCGTPWDADQYLNPGD